MNYDQGPFVPDSGDYPSGLVDSYVVLADGTTGNAAIGHCTTGTLRTLNFSTMPTGEWSGVDGVVTPSLCYTDPDLCEQLSTIGDCSPINGPTLVYSRT